MTAIRQKAATQPLAMNGRSRCEPAIRQCDVSKRLVAVGRLSWQKGSRLLTLTFAVPQHHMDTSTRIEVQAQRILVALEDVSVYDRERVMQVLEQICKFAQNKSRTQELPADFFQGDKRE